MSTENNKCTGLYALECDKRLDGAERMRWLDLCAVYHARHEACRAAYAQRELRTPCAPSSAEYEALHQSARDAEIAMDAMRDEYGGFIPWPIA